MLAFGLIPLICGDSNPGNPFRFIVCDSRYILSASSALAHVFFRFAIGFLLDYADGFRDSGHGFLELLPVFGFGEYVEPLLHVIVLTG